MIRLFTAIEIPPEIQKQLSSLAFGLKKANWVPASDLHLTLRFIGEVDGVLFNQIKEDLSSVEGFKFDIKFKGLDFFKTGKTPRVVWAGVEKPEPLITLRNQIEKKLVELGIEKESRKYSPHLTLARLKASRANEVARYLQENAWFESNSFTAHEFVLISSKLTHKGPIYTIEESYILC